MTKQNKVSASFPPPSGTGPGDKDLVIKMIGDMRAKMPFLITLTEDEIHNMTKMGKHTAQLVEKANRVLTEFPDILPKSFDAAEYKKDYQLAKDLKPIAEQLTVLLRSIENTLLAAESDTVVAALDIYGSVKLNEKSVPGLNQLAAEMGDCFKRTPRKPAAPPAS